MKLSYSSLEELYPQEPPPRSGAEVAPAASPIEPLSVPAVMLWGVVGLVAIIDFLRDLF